MTLSACMVVHSFYPDDPRVRREAEALVDGGWAVDVVCLRGDRESRVDEFNGVRVHRLPIRRHRGAGAAVYLLEYASFFAMASAVVTRLHLRRRFHVVQAHNMPDFLVFTGLLPKLLGAAVVLDIHDLVPELYGIKFGFGPGHRLLSLMRRVERISTRFADHVLTAGEPFRRKLAARSVPGEKVTVIMNTADPALFEPSEGKAPAPQGFKQDNFTLMYHGGLFERYGLDIAIRAVALLRDQIPRLKLHIYGQGEASEPLALLVEELGLGETVHLGGFVPIDRVPALVREADLGVVPYRSNPFTDLLYPTKAFEYLQMGVPVVMSSTGAVAELFAQVPDMMVPPDDVEALARRILELYRDPTRLKMLLSDSRRSYAPYSWESQKRKYLGLMRQVATSSISRPYVEQPAGESNAK